MDIKMFFFILISNYCHRLVHTVPRNISHIIKNLVNDYGYPFEIHHVETEDGYTLELHRIPHGNQNTKFEGKKPVAFIKHGLADSSGSFLATGPNQALAYILADKGYDVWLGNNRGNIFCRKHKIYSENNRKFWNFSWHEIGLYDDTAMIDYILMTTEQEKMFHVCHSQGCAELYVMTSLRPEYNKKIGLSINLAPGVTFGHPNPLVKIVFTAFYLLKDIFAKTGYIKIFDQTFLVKSILAVFCKNVPILRPICYIGTVVLYGFDWFQTDVALLPKFFKFYPAGTSIKQVIHYAALQFYPGTFRQFDYGKSRNLEIYKSTIPPKYPLEKVSVPVVIFYGNADRLVTFKDAKTVIKLIPHVIENHELNNYNHAGFMLQKSAKKLVYEKVLNLFEKYRKNTKIQ